MPKFLPQAIEIMSMVDTWARSFRVDREAILRQISIASAWIDSNKKKAPKKNMVRFLFNWMTKAQKYGNLVAKPFDRSYREDQPPDELLLTGDDFKRMNEAISRRKAV